MHWLQPAERRKELQTLLNRKAIAAKKEEAVQLQEGRSGGGASQGSRVYGKITNIDIHSNYELNDT